LLGRVLLDEGEYIVVEDPTYIAALNVFKMQKVKIIGIPIDIDGMRIDILEETVKKLDNDGKKIKFVYTIPIAQKPSGITMSFERKKYLLELAEKYDFLIIEDDAYGMPVFDEHIDITPLYSLDRYGRVIYIDSLSKVLAPGLRLGHLVAPTPIIEMIEIFKQVADLHTSAFTQYIAAYAFKRKVIERNIQKMKTIYKLKRDTMIEA
jgi:2-aminoadipate transaminase